MVKAPTYDNSGTKMRNPAERFADDPKSRAKAVAAKCWDCCAEQRSEIRKCPMTDCSLWHFRPYK
jgi:hypothetical protein